MAFDRFKGQVQDTAGRAEAAVGDVTGDRSLQAEGLARQVGGQAQDAYGAAKGQLQDAAGRLSDAAGDAYAQSGDYAQRGTDAVTKTLKDYPLSALLLAAAFGFLACLLIQGR